ncbi:MAG: hypothetical protein IT270_08360 [Saprospiraceae bacterium]|nr:hypothetical protein [Saprospiraceae bacterium]
MRNFPKKVYGAGTQNWDATQDKYGVMYWANNEGLLRYDGTFWTCLPVANNTIVRSVAIDKQGRIFVGAQSELGYFAPERNGKLTYHSLSGLLPEAQRNFEDVWDIVFSGDDVFFRTNKVVFQYSDGKLITHTPGGELTALFSTLQGLLLQQDLNQILTFSNGKFQPFVQVPELKSALTGYQQRTPDTLLLSSLKDGLFVLNGKNSFGRWVTAHDAMLRNNRIYCATSLPNGQWALGTSLEGLIVLDAKRRVFRHLTKKSGLQNTNILCVFDDQAGNLWLGLDNGIDCVVMDSPFTSIVPDGELQGTGYTAAMFQNQLYLGVSNGVYVAPWQKFYNPEQEPFFQKVPSTDGQVWSLNTIGNNLLLGHHEGAFRLSGNNAARLSSEPGAWTFVQLTGDYMLGGNYNGLVLYKKTGQGWEFKQKIEGLNESCRIMVKDADGSVWISHPYRGLYRIVWSDENKARPAVTFFNAANGLPSDLNNYVFQIAGKAVVATERGVYRFDPSGKKFVPDEDFNRMLGNKFRVRYLREDSKGNVWYATSQEVGMLRINDFGLKKEVTKKVFPELTGKLVGGFEFIYPIDEGNVIIGAEQGFIHYNAASTPGLDTVLHIILSNISAGGDRDSVLFDGGFPDFSPKDAPVLHAGMNNLYFSYSATDFKNPVYTQYRVQLVGHDRNWSEWSGETKRVYTSLTPGKYTFNVQARRKDGLESGIASYTFRIRPPWYASTVALVLYGFTILGFFAWLLFRQRQKFEHEKTQLRVKHQEKQAEQQREVEQSKAALTDILNEKLETEIKFKNQELASATMHLVQKGEILLTVQEALDRILEKSTNPGVKKDIQQLLNLLNSDTKLDEDWEQFAFHFDQVHVDFLKRLREQFPQLSLNDHKLSAYLRMNLSTKEIAPLMNISVRGVEASRYRLRKKLGLPNDANLTEFMMEV